MLEKIKTLEHLSSYFSIRDKNILDFIEKKELISEKIILIKKNGGFRKCYKIKNDNYSMLIKGLNKELYRLYSPNECVHGFVKNKGIFSNASRHLNKKILVNIDIKNFFDSISTDAIIQSFIKLGINEKIIPVIFELVTINNILPTGFSTSPTISNIICQDMDNDFLLYAKQNGYIYTRYCDDITFSTDTNNFLKKDNIKEILKKYGFILNEKKFKIQKKGGNRYVTGLTVCENTGPRIPRHIKKKLRQEAYYISKFGLSNHVLEMENRGISHLLSHPKVINGWADFIKPIEPKLYNSLIKII